MILLAMLLACGGSQTTADLLAPLPTDAAEALDSCARQPIPELAITCRVESAARAATQGRPDVAEQACREIPEGLWREECHFRAGEEFGRAVVLDEALSHCARAGEYSRFCLTHLAWRRPPDAALTPADVPAVLEAWRAETAIVDAALAQAQPDFAHKAKAQLASRFWYNLYFGGADASPGAARAAPESAGPAARQAFALEAVRLIVPRGHPGSVVEVPPDLVERVVAIWNGAAPPTGTALAPHDRHGRYHPPITVPAQNDLDTLPLYGGNQRIVADTPEDDLIVAILEALYFHPEVPADVFVPFLHHEDEAVRWTAARLVRVTPSPTLAHADVLQRMVDSGDPGLVAHGEQGLRKREWERFTGAPRPGERPPPPPRDPPGP